MNYYVILLNQGLAYEIHQTTFIVDCITFDSKWLKYIALRGNIKEHNVTELNVAEQNVTEGS